MIAKRILVLLLAAGLAAVFLGCGGQAPEPETQMVPATPPPPPEEPVVETPPEEPPAPKPEPVAQLDDVFFAFDKYNLTDESKVILEDNADELKGAPSTTLLIEGHCDERGTKSYNLALGEKRARAAKDYLVALGVPASRISIISYGKERPFDMGHNEAAWAKNRRAHMVTKK
jgi:peptidoglycan-associated lipoprotein